MRIPRAELEDLEKRGLITIVEENGRVRLGRTDKGHIAALQVDLRRMKRLAIASTCALAAMTLAWIVTLVVAQLI